MNRRERVGHVEVTFEFRRHVGGMFQHGGLTLRFDSMLPFEFVSQAEWPGAENYDGDIRMAVEETLMALQGHLEKTRVVLARIEWDRVSSSKIGFRRAAETATRAAFQV